jgi:hypothetical protein
LTNDIFLLARKHHPQTIQVIPLERASFYLTFNLASLNEFVLILPEADAIVSEVRPTGLLEYNASMPRGSLEFGLASLQSGSLLDPLEKRLVGQAKFFNDGLDALGTDNLPVFSTVTKLGDMFHQRKLVAVLFEKPVVGLLKSNAMIPDTSSHRHHPIKPVPLAAFVHSEFVADFHLDVTLIFNDEVRNSCLCNELYNTWQYSQYVAENKTGVRLISPCLNAGALRRSR